MTEPKKVEPAVNPALRALRASKIESLVTKMASKYGKEEITKMNTIAMTNLLIKKGLISEDEYQNEILGLLEQNASKLLGR